MALTLAEQREAIALRDEMDRRKKQAKLNAYKPYPKQFEFHEAGSHLPAVIDRMLNAGNQNGKTWCAGMEVAMHVTGQYADWWPGYQYRHAPMWWAGSDTGESTRDTVQRILMGRPHHWGEGAIPGSCIVDVDRDNRGAPDALKAVRVRHTSGDIAYIGFKSYAQGREKWQGETLDGVWFDEEPPEDIYTEGKARVQAGNHGNGGMTILTFTPLKGMSSVVKRFLMDKAPGTHVTTMTIYDALHYSEEQRQQIIAGYPAHQRKARAFGIPTMGSGLIFPVEEDLLIVDRVPDESHIARIIGIDFGWDHPTAAAELRWDRDNDVIYVAKDYAVKQTNVVAHASNLRKLMQANEIPVAWPHDGLQTDKGSGEQLAKQYRDEGLAMLDEHATFEDGGNSVEAGVMEMLSRMETGRWKVARQCGLWLQEFRLYHRENGMIVKLDDDVISASRYGMMMLRHAKTLQTKQRTRLRFSSEFGR
jgi:phage terminase large subunit-like protein